MTETRREREQGHYDAERGFEVGKDEAWFANIKRTFDEYQQLGVESARRNRTHVDKCLSDAEQFDNQRQVIANQALQNAVETANMVGKQAVRHSDLSIDRQWNLEPSEGASQDAVLARSTVEALRAVMVAAVAEGVSKALDSRE